MRNLLEAGKLLLLDMVSTIFFLVAFLLTHNVPLSVGLGMALGIAKASGTVPVPATTKATDFTTCTAT